MDRRQFIINSSVVLAAQSFPFTSFARQHVAPDNDLTGAIFSSKKPEYQHKIYYGADKNNFFELRMPENVSGKIPLALVIHGGYWRNKYSLDYMSYFCEWLLTNGIASANIEYRRIGDENGGYPGTFLDIAGCIDAIPEKLKTAEGVNIDTIDLSNIVLIGHSAGGHLATWAYSRKNIAPQSVLYKQNPLPVKSVVSLAGLLDLEYAEQHHLSDDAVLELLNGVPLNSISGSVSPIDMLPIADGNVCLLHGDKDNNVPIEISARYAKKAHGKRMHKRYIVINGAGHFDLVNPEFAYFKTVGETILSTFAGKTVG